ncbi:unnamed protein product [Kuraishia capsulata CBS 1993]|uniref:CP-type G domain-containing protein n=1 Tax=Kuraishia capsulata CBS 1993 TaxID=1382522 RepID=W6MJE9_9ASCO|nr:uncharacterized protein KUCA_T00002632001 [Kuraishia capsulata CBS 1993]CDK26659.1 unnamed protein product [Kuraishia capsulata CBS 1993]
MRVRKPTSKRTSTRMKEGIKKKAAAQNRKNKKLAKKDPTWRSKNKKDPGIPASFPYKDRLIAEIEEKKREEKALKDRRKAERRALQAGGAVSEEIEASDDDDMEEEGNGLEALMASAQRAAAAYENGSDEDEDMSGDDMEEDTEVVEYPIEYSDNEDSSEIEKSRKAYDKIFKAVVDASDVVLYVLDARDPDSTRSKRVEEAVLQSQGKRLILILNKIDLIPEDVLKQWLDFLKSSFPTIPLKASSSVSSAKSFNKKMSQSVTANALLAALKSYANKSNLKRSLIVGVIGYPNVGKSSLINALTSRHGGSSKACPVGNQAGVTTSLREVKLDNKLKIIDSPGIVFPDSKKLNKKQQEAQLALLNAIPPKQITDPTPAVSLMLKRLAKSPEMTERFKEHYQLPPMASHDLNDFTNSVLIHVARKMGRLGKGGIPNLTSAGLAILSDWHDGKFAGWVLPNSSKQQASESAIARGTNEPAKVEQTTVVNQWAKEFDLDGLLNGAFDA